MPVLVSQQVVDAYSRIFSNEIFGAKQMFQFDVPGDRTPPPSEQQVPKESVVSWRHEGAYVACLGRRQVEEVAGDAAGDLERG